jgi:hypothetical protein
LKWTYWSAVIASTVLPFSLLIETNAITGEVDTRASSPDEDEDELEVDGEEASG